MSFAASFFLSQLSSAVRAAQAAASEADRDSRAIEPTTARTDILTQLAQGEISVEEAARRLEHTP
jgi:hypothetical protein